MSAMASRLSLISFVSVLNDCALVVVEEGVAVVELLVEVDVEVEDVSGDQKLARGCVVIDGRTESSAADRGRMCRVIEAAIILLYSIEREEDRDRGDEEAGGWCKMVHVNFRICSAANFLEMGADL